MLSKNEILKMLGRLKRNLSLYGVSSVGLFGSFSRGDADEDSDIDILIDFEKGHESYGNFMLACDLLEEEFKDQKLDIVTRKGLSPYIGEYILQEVVYV